jgi:hypothetical protein
VLVEKLDGGVRPGHDNEERDPIARYFSVVMPGLEPGIHTSFS